MASGFIFGNGEQKPRPNGEQRHTMPAIGAQMTIAIPKFYEVEF